MKITDVKTIDRDIVSVRIYISEFGTATMNAEEEKNLLENFIRSIEFNDIDFKANMKVESNLPVITSEAVDDTTVVEVGIPDLINKKYNLDSSLDIVLEIDVSKIPNSELNAVMNTKELLGQARIILFTDKIIKAISEKLVEIRSLYNTFEGTHDTIV